jgi:hypothetical protein
MQRGMFRSPRIVGRRENRLLALEMLNHIANKGVDDRICLIHGSPGEYRGSQIIGVIGQALVLRVDHAVAGKRVIIGTVPAECLHCTQIFDRDREVRRFPVKRIPVFPRLQETSPSAVSQTRQSQQLAQKEQYVHTGQPNRIKNHAHLSKKSDQPAPRRQLLNSLSFRISRQHGLNNHVNGMD